MKYPFLYAVDRDSDDEYTQRGIPEAKAPRREAVYDFSDSDEDEEELEKRLKKVEASLRRRQKVTNVEILCKRRLNRLIGDETCLTAGIRSDY